MDHFIAGMAYRLWDLRQGGIRLIELDILEKEQWLSGEQFEAIQFEKLKALLLHAEMHSPWYRQLFKTTGIQVASIDSLEGLLQLPVTTKSDIRENTEKFIADNYNKDHLKKAKTGGSTGFSLNLFFDEICQQKRNAAQGFTDGWAGWKPGSRVAALWGNPPVAKSLKAKIRSFLLERMIFLDTMELNERSMFAFVKEWRRFTPDILFGHAHSLYIFAKFLKKSGIEDLRPKGIVATSMMLLEHERKTISNVFGVAVSNRYGCEEVGLIACECEQHKGMHINRSHVILECLDENDRPVPMGKPGKLVVTDLNNFAMPLIRYRVEDVGVLSERICCCGRGLPMLEKLEGRIADFLKKIDGTEVSGVSLVERTLTKIPGIEQMQLVQNTLHEITVNRVKGREYNQHTDQQLLAELQMVFSKMVNIKINDVEKVQQEQSGKYRFSICKV